MPLIRKFPFIEALLVVSEQIFDDARCPEVVELMCDTRLTATIHALVAEHSIGCEGLESCAMFILEEEFPGWLAQEQKMKASMRVPDVDYQNKVLMLYVSFHLDDALQSAPVDQLQTIIETSAHMLRKALKL